MREPICYVIGAGELYPAGLEPKVGDWVIAADGGYRALRALGLRADLVVGDFDSLEERPDHPNVMTLPREKDDTDMAVALEMGVKRGYRTFRLYGGTGGRIDHTLANLQCLTWLSRRGCRGELYGENWTAAAVTDGALTFDASHRGYVSVFCQGDRAEGVTLRGLKYPLDSAALTPDVTLGVSNEFTGAESSIAVRTGTLLVVWAAGWPGAPSPLGSAGLGGERITSRGRSRTGTPRD